jgi:hypothetical protein
MGQRWRHHVPLGYAETSATRLIAARTPVPAVRRQGNWKTPGVLMSIYAEADRASHRTAIRFPHRSGAVRMGV